MTNDTPLYQLTVGEFADLLNSLNEKKYREIMQSIEAKENVSELIYGNKGLEQLLDCKSTKIWKLKAKLDKAIISRTGRKTIYSRTKVLEILNK